MEYPNDEALVDEYDKLQSLKAEIEKRLEDLKETIIKIAQQKSTNLLLGTTKVCSIKEYMKVLYPQDKTQLTAVIKAKGLYEQLSTLNYFKLNPRIIKGELDKEILDLVRKEKAFRISLMERGFYER